MKKNEPILIACEESGIVTKQFIELGFTNVFSCDLMKTSGNYPDRHIVGDVLPILNGNCRFNTSDGSKHELKTTFSLIIAFPPCTHLCVSGARHFKQKIADGRQQQGIDFFMLFANADCEKIAIENPIGIMSNNWRKPDQIIQPYQFGDKFQKSTCIWLKGLHNLVPTDIVEKGEFVEWVDKKTHKKKRQSKWFFDALKNAKTAQERSCLRSKTFPGIAKAMATQWGDETGKYCKQTSLFDKEQKFFDIVPLTKK